MQNKDFDQFIQNALENQPEPEYNPADWDKLEDRLHNLHASQPSVADKVIKGGSSFGKLGFAATAILVTALNVVFFTQPELVKTTSEKIAAVSNAVLSEPETNLATTTASDNTVVAKNEVTATQEEINNQIPLAENAAETGTVIAALPTVTAQEPGATAAIVKPKANTNATSKTKKTTRNTLKPATNFAVAPSAAGRPGTTNGAGLLGGKPTAAAFTPCGIVNPEIVTLIGADTLRGNKIALTSCQALNARFVSKEAFNSNVTITSNVAKVLPGAKLVANPATGVMTLQWQPKAEMARQQAYNFNVYISDARCPDATAKAIPFAVNVAPAFNAAITGNTQLEAGEGTTLEVSGAPANSTYKWLVGKQEVATRQTNNQVILPLTNTTYRVEIISPAGCTFTDSIKVEVAKQKEVAQNHIPNIFTPNGDGINDHFVVRLATEEAIDLVIIDRYGKEVYNRKNYDNRWNATNVESGTYYYIISTQETKKTFKGWVEIIR